MHRPFKTTEKRLYPPMKSTTSRSTHLVGILYACAAFTLWGLLPLYWKLLKEMPATEILAHRVLWCFVFVLGLLTVWGRWRDLRAALTKGSTLGAVLLSSLLISFNWFLYIWAINNNHLVESSLGYYINPLLNVLLGVVVLKERLNGWQLVSLLLALTGVSIITLQYGKVPWISLSLALSFALYGLVKKLTRLDAITGLAIETMMVAPVAFGYILLKQFRGTGSFGSANLSITLLLIFSGVVTALPLLCFARGANLVPLSTIGFTQYLSPSITLLLGIFVFREPFTKVEMLSFAFIWGALVVYSVSQSSLKFYAKALTQKQ